MSSSPPISTGGRSSGACGHSRVAPVRRARILRAPCLATDQDRGLEAPGGEVEGGLVDEGLGGVASRRRVGELRGGEAETFGEQPCRVAVAPREQADDADRVHVRRPGQPCVGRGAGDRLLHQCHRIDGVVNAVGALQELAGTDDDGRTRIERHPNHPRFGPGQP